MSRRAALLLCLAACAEDEPLGPCPDSTFWDETASLCLPWVPDSYPGLTDAPTPTLVEVAWECVGSDFVIEAHFDGRIERAEVLYVDTSAWTPETAPSSLPAEVHDLVPWADHVWKGVFPTDLDCNAENFAVRVDYQSRYEPFCSVAGLHADATLNEPEGGTCACLDCP
ncbi:MAG: hypothetical protein EP330_26295 [Deltaproteobacteria bacterium]|nr:MAG: hypothetical protein EP330_26295 [Deltaproteobacteria bacterium]